MVRVAFLDPSEVPRNWVGVVKIVGSGFDRGAFALFDASAPETKFVSEIVLNATITSAVTDSVGSKVVEVHTADGTVSNSVLFAVRPRP